MSMRQWSEIDKPPCKDREQWLKELTHIEWWPDEISEGKPWNRLKDYLW